MASMEVLRGLAKIGVGTLPAEQAIEALGCLLQSDTVQKTIATVDWNLFKPIYEARGRRPLLERIGTQSLSIDKQPPVQEPEFRRRLDVVPPRERRELLIAHIKESVLEVLGLDPSEPLDPQKPLMDLGLDSLMAVELGNLLRTSLGQASRLPATLIFKYPTIEALADYVARNLLSLETPPQDFRSESRKEVDELGVDIAEIGQLSADEVRQLLAAELKALSPK